MRPLFDFLKRYKIAVLLVLIVAQILILMVRRAGFADVAVRIKTLPSSISFGSQNAAAIYALPVFRYTFNVDGALEEAGNMDGSNSFYWWLNSGGYMYIKNGIGSTVVGNLPRLSFWRILYSKTNPIDTDNGYRPQNIFRLVSRNKWQDAGEEAYFKIVNNNLSDSPNRNQSNGLLLFSRYQDSDNLYYAGIRVDGHLVIKKKVRGEYTTLAEESFIEGTYNREANPNLIPKDKWIGLKFEVENTASSSTILRLWTDFAGDGSWKLGLTAEDKNIERSSLLDPGFAGIRTDFMDVEFKEFKIVKK